MVDKKYLRNIIRIISTFVFFWLYIPHLIAFVFCNRRDIIVEDCKANMEESFSFHNYIALLYLLHSNKYFRVLFYYRLGPVISFFIGWYRPGGGDFIISPTTKLGAGVRLYHPYSTIIYAEEIGCDFGIAQCCTLGKKNGKRPRIGNHVTICPGTIVVGDVLVGNNSILGAGSIVVKNIPDNSIAAGNPAKVLKNNL